MNANSKNTILIKKICGIGVFAALAYITVFVCKLIPNVAGFLSLELKDSIIAIASFIYGPIAAPVISLIVAFIELITISTTGPWGFLMNFASSTVFSLTASLIYKYRKTFNGAIIGFAASTILTTAVMIALNPIIVPLYSGVSSEVVVGMIPGILLPFNFAKTLLNGAIAMLLYKPIITAMRKARLVPSKQASNGNMTTEVYKTEFNRSSVITLIIGGVSIILAFVILFIIW